MNKASIIKVNLRQLLKAFGLSMKLRQQLKNVNSTELFLLFETDPRSMSICTSFCTYVLGLELLNKPTLLVFKILLIFTRLRRERLMIQHHSEHTELTVTTDITSARGSKWTRWRPHKPTTALVSISSIISRGKTLDWNTIMMQHYYVNQAKTKSYRYRQTFHIKYFPPNSPQLEIL